MTLPLPPSIRRAAVAILAVLFFLPFAFAHGTLVMWNDDGVDYTDDGTSEVYVALAFDGEAMWVTFHDDAPEGALPAIVFEIPDLEREDIFGNDIGALLSDINEVQWTASGRDIANSPHLTGVTFTHEGVTVADAVAAYAVAFDALGFDVSMGETVTDAVKLGTFTNGDHEVRIDVRSTGNNEVQVAMTTL